MAQLHYENGAGRLFQGDALDWLKSLAGESADLVFASGSGQSYDQTRAADATAIGRVRLTYVEAENDFEVRTIEAVFPDDSSTVVAETEFDLLLVESEARGRCRTLACRGKIGQGYQQILLAKIGIGSELRGCCCNLWCNLPN